MSGTLRESVKLYSIDRTVNSLGEPVKSNVFVKNIRVSVKYDNGTEKESDSQLMVQQVLTFSMRYDPTITETMVIEYLGKLYDIRFISHLLRVETYIKATKQK